MAEHRILRGFEGVRTATHAIKHPAHRTPSPWSRHVGQRRAKEVARGPLGP